MSGRAERTKEVLTSTLCISTTFHSFGSVSNAEPITKVKAIISADLLAWNCFLTCKMGIINLRRLCCGTLSTPHSSLQIGRDRTASALTCSYHMVPQPRQQDALEEHAESDEPQCELWLCLIIPLCFLFYFISHNTTLNGGCLYL